MMKTRELGDGYRTEFSNGRISGVADMPVDKGGKGEGLRPHELLEAALASCLVMTLRIAAEKYDYPLVSAAAEVTLDRTDPQGMRLDYALRLEGPLSDAQREHLERAAAGCPVGQTLASAPRLNRLPG